MYILFRSQRYFLHDSRLKINVSKSRFHHRYIWSKVFTGSSLVGGCCFLSGLRLAPSYKFNYPPSFLSPSSLLPLSGNSKSITCIYIDIDIDIELRLKEGQKHAIKSIDQDSSAFVFFNPTYVTRFLFVYEEENYVTGGWLMKIICRIQIDNSLCIYNCTV